MTDEKARKKLKWFSGMKKVFKHGRKQEKAETSNEDEWFVTHPQTDCYATNYEIAPPNCSPPVSLPEEMKSIETSHGADDDHIPPPAIPPVDFPSFSSAQTSREAYRVAMAKRFEGKSQQEVAAIKIQTAYRGHQSRKALRALRGLVRLKLLMEGQTIKRQATHTLKCMQTLSRVQSQITYRRIRMSEEKQALQRQLLQKHAKELETLRLDEVWDDSFQSKEQIEANLLGKYEASVRRERSLAYSFSHQQTWKSSPRSSNPMFMNPHNPSWGWTWLERWVAAHPWENRNITEKESTPDQSSVKSSNRGIIKSFVQYQKNSDKLSPGDSEKPDQITTPKQGSFIPKKVKAANPRGVFRPDDDAKSTISVHSVKSRRRSTGDEEGQVNSSLPSYMVPTESTMARSKLQGSPMAEGNTTPDKVLPAATKKRLSYPSSPGRLRTRNNNMAKFETTPNAVEAIVNNAV